VLYFLPPHVTNLLTYKYSPQNCVFKTPTTIYFTVRGTFWHRRYETRKTAFCCIWIFIFMNRRRKDKEYFAVNHNKHYPNLTLFYFLSECSFYTLYILTLPYLKKNIYSCFYIMVFQYFDNCALFTVNVYLHIYIEKFIIHFCFSCL
jgi:hypothetical protein